jgi:hypothetical protein
MDLIIQWFDAVGKLFDLEAIRVSQKHVVLSGNSLS